MIVGTEENIAAQHGVVLLDIYNSRAKMLLKIGARYN